MEVFILIKTSLDDDYNFTHCNLGVYTKEAKDALEKTWIENSKTELLREVKTLYDSLEELKSFESMTNMFFENNKRRYTDRLTSVNYVLDSNKDELYLEDYMSKNDYNWDSFELEEV